MTNWNWWPLISALAVLVAFMIGWTSVRRIRCRVRVTSWKCHKSAWIATAIAVTTVITMMVVSESGLGVLAVAERFIADGESEAGAVVFALPIILITFVSVLYLTLFAAAVAGEKIHEHLAQYQATQQLECCRKAIDIQCPWVLDNCPCRDKAKAVITAEALKTAKRSRTYFSSGLQLQVLEFEAPIRPEDPQTNTDEDHIS